MKIAASHPPPPPGTQPLQARFGEYLEQHPDGFADLLAALLTPASTHNAGRDEPQFPLRPSYPTTETRAADFAPAIGAHGNAFEHARLLVQTALEFPGFEEAGSTIRCLDVLRSIPSTPAGPLGQPVTDASPADLIEFLGQYIDRATSAAHANGGAGSVNPLPLGIAASQTGATQVSSAHEASTLARIGTSEGPDTTEQTRGADVSPARPNGRAAPFGAQLLAFDGGLRLLLRLPRLAEGERGELEASLTRLLESFGHRKHEIVIHEIAKGQG